MNFCAKVLTTVGNKAHKGPSLYEAFLCSLFLVLQAVWEQINANANNNDNIDNSDTAEQFDERLCEFIAVHSTAKDQYELAQFLRKGRKPRELPVQAFWYKLCEFNSYLDWLPGMEPLLNDQQMRQAFHDSMPPTWHEQFANTGNLVATMSMAKVVQYFCKQEGQATHKMLENNQQQRKQSLARKKAKPHHNGTKPSGKDKGSGCNSAKRGCVSNDGPCPVHPRMGHKWGNCHANAYNKERDNFKCAIPMEAAMRW